MLFFYRIISWNTHIYNIYWISRKLIIIRIYTNVQHKPCYATKWHCRLPAYRECRVAVYGESSFNLAVDRVMAAFGLTWMQLEFSKLLKRNEKRTRVLGNALFPRSFRIERNRWHFGDSPGYVTRIYAGHFYSQRARQCRSNFLYIDHFVVAAEIDDDEERRMVVEAPEIEIVDI